jgi:hypothetical protein
MTKLDAKFDGSIRKVKDGLVLMTSIVFLIKDKSWQALLT